MKADETFIHQNNKMNRLSVSNVVNLVNVEMSIGKYVVKGLGWRFVQESSNFHCQSLQCLLTV